MNWQPGADRPLTADQVGEWRGRLERSARVMQEFYPQMERALKRYTEAKVSQGKTDVNALLDFRHVESKKSDLFYRTPEMRLRPVDVEDRSLPQDVILPLRQKYLNHKLGPKEANVKAELHKTLLDAIAVSGWLIVEIGYENRTAPVELQQPAMFQPGAPPQTVTVKVPVWERCFVSRVSPKKFGCPDDFADTTFDKAPWLSVKGTIGKSAALAQGWAIPEDFEGTATTDRTRFDHGVSPGDPVDPKLEYEKIWYRASEFDASVLNPELFRCLILVTGLETPAKHIDSPYQSVDGTGRLTDDSLIGNPIHVGTLRDLTDSAVVPSDLVVGEQLSEEVNAFRTDGVRGRRSRRPFTLVSDAIGQDKAAQLLKDRGGVIPASHIQPGGQQDLIVIVQAGSEPRDNYAIQDRIEQDHEQALGQGANQQGHLAKSKRTATEVRAVSNRSSARAETEKDRVREYFIALVWKYDAVLQRFATAQELKKVLGAQGGALWEQWRALPGKYVYDIVPDSGRHVDAAQDAAQAIDEYQMFRRDDRINTDELLKRTARRLNYDPTTFVAPPSDKTIEPPKTSAAINLVDMNDPVAGRVALDLFANAGVKLSPDTIALIAQAHALLKAAGAMAGGPPVGAQTPPNPHAGPAAEVNPLSKHQRETTGGMQGVGVTSAP